MQLTHVLALRGPNVWARFPVLEAWVDLGELKDSASSELPGFNERLRGWLPSLIEHRCSEGGRGGFFRRLERGTYLAHVLEHVALELQTLAGTEVGLRRTRLTSADGVYKVAVEYRYEELGRAALESGRELCLAAVYDRPYDLGAVVQNLRELAARLRPDPLAEALLTAAAERGIPARPLDEAGALIQLGHGAAQRRVLAGQTDGSSAVGNSIAYDRELTRLLLRSAGVPVPDGRTATGADDAWAAAEEAGLPVVMRPRYASGCGAVTGPLATREEVLAVYEAAATEGWTPLVEHAATGDVYRLLVIGRGVAAAEKPGEAPSPELAGRLCPALAGRAVAAAAALGLEVAGVEVVAGDPARPLEEQGGCVVGVTGQPDVGRYLGPGPGGPPPVAAAIVDHLF